MVRRVWARVSTRDIKFSARVSIRAKVRKF